MYIYAHIIRVFGIFGNIYITIDTVVYDADGGRTRVHNIKVARAMGH